MEETTQFTIGADASCIDGLCGKVTRVVVDPVAREVTHLVVEPIHRQGLGRLVPLNLVDATGGDVRLRCSLEDFDKLDLAEETQFLPGSGGALGYETGQMYEWPYYGTGVGIGLGVGNVSMPLVVDRIPLGEVAIRRGEQVHAIDGAIGKVHGLLIDRHDHHVTHVLLQEGHLLNRKEVAIPIGAVVDVTDGIHLNLAKQQVQDLAPVDLENLAE